MGYSLSGYGSDTYEVTFPPTGVAERLALHMKLAKATEAKAARK